MIIDAFPFFNELDILELRFEYLSAIVDKFVIIESAFTFSGKPKPLYYFENRERFARYKNKITHYALLECPPEHDHDWGREHYQRNKIADGLRLAGAVCGDYILLSDVDEIPRISSVIDAIPPIWDGMYRVVSFDQSIYYYYFNLKGNIPWHGTRLFDYNIVDNYAIQTIRHMEDRVMPIAGWHFSHCNGGVEKIQEKLFAGSHQELNKAEYTNLDKLSARIQAGKDLFDRNIQWELVEIDATYPEVITNNLDKWKAYIK